MAPYCPAVVPSSSLIQSCLCHLGVYSLPFWVDYTCFFIFVLENKSSLPGYGSGLGISDMASPVMFLNQSNQES